MFTNNIMQQNNTGKNSDKIKLSDVLNYNQIK